MQKSGDAVRVNVQLIKAANDSHLWADTFDRKLTDIFSVESEVTKAIAEQLRARLTGQEEQVIAATPTDNPEAYDAYLRGLAYSLKTAATPANAFGTGISERSGAVRPEVCPCLGASVIRGSAGLPNTDSSTNGRPARGGATGSRNSAHSSAQSRRGYIGQGILPLLLPKGLRHGGALLSASASAPAK